MTFAGLRDRQSLFRDRFRARDALRLFKNKPLARSREVAV